MGSPTPKSGGKTELSQSCRAILDDRDFMPAIPNIFSDGKPEEEIVPRSSFRRALHEIALYVGIGCGFSS